MRYFLEVSYKGTSYAGFQVQKNANTIQGEVEKALTTICGIPISLTGASRTDAGVHAFQNFFHFDIGTEFNISLIYNLNALLPLDIVAKGIYTVSASAHSRFMATSREYQYFISTQKDPFTTDTAWYYPFSVDVDLLNKAAKLLLNYTDYTTFSKKNTQVKTNDCKIIKSFWVIKNSNIVYTVEANRFLRGMVRGLVGTMLLVGRNKITISAFDEIIKSRDCTRASFATPSHGLFLVKVNYPMLFN